MSIKFCTSESQAGTKRCVHSEPDRLCIGSECMAWRWVETHISDGQGGLTPSSETHGYCGLAGLPLGYVR